MSASSSEVGVEGKAGWWISNFSDISKIWELNWEEGRMVHWLKNLLFSPHDISQEMFYRSVVCAHSLIPTGQQEVLHGERPVSPATSCGAFPLRFPTTTIAAWGMSGSMSLPLPFRTYLWSWFLWICPTPFWTCCHCLPAMTADSQSLLPAVQRNISPLSNSFSNSLTKFPLILLLQNWWLTIVPLSHAPYPLSS